MRKDPESDPTYSSLENPTAAYPRDKLGTFFDSEDSEPAVPAPPPPSDPPALGHVAPTDHGVSMLYLGMALVGGGLLAVGVSGIVAVLFFAGS